MPEKSSIRRCAVYTRKSSEEGLEQDFNSLHAQREACEAYIRSQAGEGWKPVRTTYDDGGISGGTMDRPGLTSLLEDIRAGRVDTVIVYKVDRLTRSLADFAKIVEVFDTHGVSFVSVTQQFNTTTSMGRLTLNMLLSFAQFEREVTGERIRDKIAASKQKGMWMGGVAPTGYEPHGRTLTINEAEAETVRKVFQLYLEHRNVRKVKRTCDDLGIVTKVRVKEDGTSTGGRPLSRGNIYKMLSNPIYIGRIAHKDKTYEGLHPAIIDQETWDAVQACLNGNAVERPDGNRTGEASPLAGKLFDEEGSQLSPSHAVKSDRRYRYYVSRSLINGTADTAKGWRIPAHEIERIVGDAVMRLISDRPALADVLSAHGVAAADIPETLRGVTLPGTDPLTLVNRVGLSSEGVSIDIEVPTPNGMAAVTHVVHTIIRRRGVEMRLVLSNDNSTGKPDPALIKVLARAHRWFDQIASGRRASLNQVATAEGVSNRYVARLLPLAFLAPDIVEAILDGTQPIDLTAETLTRLPDLPVSWADQRALLGFN
tara:strand:+ start:285 stop:1907 length:1623 start_codon:yes stop_codon:yes gene_type:complete